MEGVLWGEGLGKGGWESWEGVYSLDISQISS
jgi:hypothetical protein